MEITEIRIFKKDKPNSKLRAFATVTFDQCFVVRDIKVIEGTKGLFVSMPSRKKKNPCPRCGSGVEINDLYCSQCGAQIGRNQGQEMSHAEEKDFQSGHIDIAHPITRDCREMIEKTILDAYAHDPGPPNRGGS